MPLRFYATLVTAILVLGACTSDAPSSSGPGQPVSGGGLGAGGSDPVFEPSADGDGDNDGIVDAEDNCPQAHNPDQADRGGLGTSDPDGVGDACQCGDFNRSGTVDNTDAVLISRYTAGNSQNTDIEVGEVALDKCDVSGDGECDILDSDLIKSSLLGITSIQAECGGASVATWNLFWSDEFNGSELDTSIWDYQLGDGKAEGLSGWGNGEEQYYAADNVSVADGNLVISSRAETVVVTDPNDPVANIGSYPYTSGRIKTEGNFDFTYGRVEARIKMPESQGIWSAFWLLGTRPGIYGESWAAIGEIDIVETYARGRGFVREPLASGAVHFGGSFPFNVFDFSSTLDFQNRYGTGDFAGGFDFFSDYHIYAVEWNDEEIRWYIDGINFYTIRTTALWSYFTDVNEFSPPVDTRDVDKYSSDVAQNRRGFGLAASPQAPFDGRFHIILNSAVGGSLPNAYGEPPIAAEIGSNGDDMLVDYVRVYKCSLANPQTGAGGNLCKNFEGRDDLVLPEDPELPGQQILANYANDAVLTGSRSYSVFSNEFPLFSEGPGAERIPNGPQLNIEGFGGAGWEVVTGSTEASPNAYGGEASSAYIRIMPSQVGAQGIGITSSDGLNMFGAIGGMSDIKFDLYVESDYNGTVVDDNYLSTGGPGFGPRIARVAITSSASNLRGEFMLIPLDEVGVGKWKRFTIPLSFLVNNGGNYSGGPADLSNINRLIEIAVAGVNLRVDNIHFACGGQSCGISAAN